MGIGELASGIGEKCKNAASKAAEFFRSNRIAAAAVGGALLIIIVLLVILAFVKSGAPKAASGPLSLEKQSIPAEDFFMPGEPDFVPEILLEREPRDGWVEEDARPFWTNPMDGNADTWRKRIEADIDELLENVE